MVAMTAERLNALLQRLPENLRNIYNRAAPTENEPSEADTISSDEELPTQPILIRESSQIISIDETPAQPSQRAEGTQTRDS